MKTYIVGTHHKHLKVALLVSTHNECSQKYMLWEHPQCMFSWRNKKKKTIYFKKESPCLKMCIKNDDDDDDDDD